MYREADINRDDEKPNHSRYVGQSLLIQMNNKFSEKFDELLSCILIWCQPVSRQTMRSHVDGLEKI